MGKYKMIVKGVVKYNNKYLIVQKWYDDRIMNPYQWEFIDGKVDFGEAPDSAVIRLINEHTDLNVEIDRPLYTWSFMMGDIQTIGISYLCLCAYDEVILSEDLGDYKWVTKDEFSNYIDNVSVLRDIEKVEL